MNSIEIEGSGKYKILILTGIHGNELTPIHCGFLLNKQKWDISKFKTLKIINAINVNGIKECVRDISVDKSKDLNRMFSNDDKTNLSEELKKEFENFDVIIDIHSSKNCTEFILINNDEYANSYVEFSEKFNVKYLLRYNNNSTIKKYGLNLGKIAFTIELNKMDNIDFESSNKGLELVNTIINNIENFEIKKEVPKYKTYKEISFYKEGILLPNYKLGDFIESEKSLGNILDIYTFEETPFIYKGNSSTIILDNNKSYKTPNDSIYWVQPKN